jgi:hypothetical protein
MVALGKMTSLTRLNLNRSSINVPVLTGLPKSLTDLNLNGCNITFRDLEKLEQDLPNLTRLEIIGSEVSREEAEFVWPTSNRDFDPVPQIFIFDGQEKDIPLYFDQITNGPVRDLEGSWRRKSPL